MAHCVFTNEEWHALPYTFTTPSVRPTAGRHCRACHCRDAHPRPIVQFANYHGFADRRADFGLAREDAALAASRAGYALFFGAILLTAFGSSWYHLAPDNARLVWDRLPIALACAGLPAAWRESAGAGRALPAALALAALASVAWWRYTDLCGLGDLRPYLLLQMAPLVLIPLLQWRRPRRERLAFGAALGLYLLAKFCEVADHAIFDALGFVSGHTLKHLLASAAALPAWQLARRLEKDRRGE